MVARVVRDDEAAGSNPVTPTGVGQENAQIIGHLSWPSWFCENVLRLHPEAFGRIWEMILQPVPAYLDARFVLTVSGISGARTGT